LAPHLTLAKSKTLPPGPFRIVTHDRFFRVYEGDELLGTEVYLKGAQRIIQRFKELAPDAVIEPYQRPPRGTWTECRRSELESTT
jgi:hypothetical protein